MSEGERREEQALKKAMVEGYEREIEKRTHVEVKPNMLVQQKFEHKVEGYQEQVYLYEDETLQAIILSLVPEEIQSITEQVG
jgi:hypothetical protein